MASWGSLTSPWPAVSPHAGPTSTRRAVSPQADHMSPQPPVSPRARRGEPIDRIPGESGTERHRGAVPISTVSVFRVLCSLGRALARPE